jgi:hydrogenase maturation protease
MGLDLLPFIEGSDRLLIIDAVDFKSPPGTVKVIEGPETLAFLDTKLSVHQIGIPDLLFAASFSGVMPAETCLVGIQPDIIEAGLEMSGRVRENFETLLNTIVDKLRQWGVEITSVPCDTL